MSTRCFNRFVERSHLKVMGCVVVAFVAGLRFWFSVCVINILG